MKLIVRLEKDEYLEDGKIWKKKNGERELVWILPDEIDGIEWNR
jgi:hypothetical protein